MVNTSRVDAFPPNPWGLYDMLGNVHEWCDDSWHSNLKGAPRNGAAWIDDPEPIDHVVRGGAAYVISSRCTCGNRYSRRANCANPNFDERRIAMTN
ncbi:MAG: SUMF1/EgtB/PvdO family nonheme iron enzyme [Pirellulales bacterium]